MPNQEYRRDRVRVDRALRKSGVVVVMNKDHVGAAGDMVATMTEVHKAGFVAEITFRIDESILREGMRELVKLRAESSPDNPFILGVGSVINPRELAAAIEMGFDMVVAPANVMGGFGEGSRFVQAAHCADVYAAPAVFTPTELVYWIERDDGLEPDAVKIFPANTHGPKGVGDLLAPFVRPRHENRIIMPTGGVDCETGPQYQAAIRRRGFTPVLGMSAPLSLVSERKKPGDVGTIRESLALFRSKFKSAY
ncbi:MAG: bifunctional 4-hydroxy-2-oxoglutarate aldolase/2-dehydro-3-deoxy-phosphogluconate aldolase [Planctomycetota bacterium]